MNRTIDKDRSVAAEVKSLFVQNVGYLVPGLAGSLWDPTCSEWVGGFLACPVGGELEYPGIWHITENLSM